MKRLFSAILVGVCLAIALLLANAQATTPDATTDIAGNSVAAGVGYTQLDGTVRFQGKSYRVHLEGLSVGEVGAQKISAAGEVYNLSRLDDYAAVSAGAALATGAVETTMRNQNGVEIRLHGKAEGVDLKLSVDRLSLTLAK